MYDIWIWYDNRAKTYCGRYSENYARSYVKFMRTKHKDVHIGVEEVKDNAKSNRKN